MAQPFKIITQDPFTAVTLDEAKSQCRLMPSFTLDDDYITGLISIAANFAQEYLHWLTSTGVVKQYSAKGGEIQLYGKFISEVTDVTYLDNDNVEQPVTDYHFNDITEILTVSTDYTELFITYPCGASVLQLPSTVKGGILMLISTMYNNREDFITGLTVANMPLTSKKMFELTRNYVS